MRKGQSLKHYYYMMQIDIASELINNEQLESYKQLIKASCNKKLVDSDKQWDEHLIIRESGIYSLQIDMNIIDETLGKINYIITRQDIVYYNGGNTMMYFDKNLEHITKIPMGEDKTILMLNHLEITGEDEED